MMTEKAENCAEQQNVIQNLKDAGCSEELIEEFMECWRKKEIQQELRLLADHRKGLLNDVHESQKRINCLDYLVYQIRKKRR